MGIPAALVPRLVFAVAFGTLGLFALGLSALDRARRGLALYGALALALSFHLARPIVRPPSGGGRADALARLAEGLSVLLPLVAIAVLFWLERRRRRPAANAAFLVFGAGSFLLGALADAAIARGVLAISSRIPFVGVGFLLFTVVLLVLLSDEDRRLLTRATTDPLTSLPNRAAFLERARLEVQRAERTGRSLAVVLFDLDHFKSVNDRFGHAAGDRTLAAAALAIARTIRGIDVAGRWGGEEFVLLLVEADESTAGPAVERIRAAVASPPTPRVPVSVTASAGIAIHHGLFERTSIEGLVRRADAALYEAKRAGRDRYAFEKALATTPSGPADVRLR